jgi:hypothetical protein
MQDSPSALVDSGLLEDHIVTKVHCLEVEKQEFVPQDAVPLIQNEMPPATKKGSVVLKRSGVRRRKDGFWSESVAHGHLLCMEKTPTVT